MAAPPLPFRTRTPPNALISATWEPPFSRGAPWGTPPLPHGVGECLKYGFGAMILPNQPNFPSCRGCIDCIDSRLYRLVSTPSADKIGGNSNAWVSWDWNRALPAALMCTWWGQRCLEYLPCMRGCHSGTRYKSILPVSTLYRLDKRCSER